MATIRRMGLDLAASRLTQGLVVLALLAASLLLVSWTAATAAAAPQAVLASVSGVAFLDSNGNGQRDPDETIGIANLPVAVEDASGSWVTITPTRSDGSYVIDGLAAGTYTVTALIDPAMGLIPTSPTAHQVDLAAGENRSGLDFGFLMTNAVYFSSAGASFQGPGLLITWSTSLEIGNNGFVLYRAHDQGGPFQPLNSELIPAQAISGGGADYEFVDETAVPCVSYYYVVEAYPGQQSIGPFALTPRPTACLFVPIVLTRP